MQQSLSQDALSTTKQAASQLSVHLSQAVNVDAEIKAIWTSETPPIQTALGIIQDAPTLTEARKAFETLSHHIETLVIHYGGPKTYHINKYYCPMVDGDRGAYWLQHTSGTQNPYFGSQMFRCGGVVKTLQ
jgi:Cu(I)/Ag(I) efflux system membrane fusion protein